MEQQHASSRGRGDSAAGGTGAARLALVALVTGVVGIAFAPIFVKVSEVGPVATAFYRVLLALPLLWVWTALTDWRDRGETTARPSSRRARLLLPLSVLLFAGDLAFWHLSLGLTSVANSTLLVNLASIFVALATWLLLGERLAPRFLAGLLAALAGVALLVGGGGGLGFGNLAGDGLAGIAAVSYAGYLLCVSLLRPCFSTAYVMAVGGVEACASLGLVAVFSGEAMLPSTAMGWAVLLALALVSQVLGQSLIAYALAHLPAAFSSAALLSQPAVAAALAWAMLRETLSPWQAAGGAVVLAGIAMARSGSRRG